MPDLNSKPWDTLVPWFRDELVPILIIVVAALIAFRLSADLRARRPQGAARSRGQRGHRPGTELGRDRQADADPRHARGERPALLHRGHRGTDDPRPARHRYRACRGRPRRRRHRGRLRRPEHGPRLPQRDVHPRREPVREGRCGPRRRRRRDRRGLHPAADHVARHRRRRPHGPQRRDQGRLEPDPRLGPHQPGRHGRLRHGHRQGDRRRGRRRSRAGRRSGLEATDHGGAHASSGSRRSPSTA